MLFDISEEKDISCNQENNGQFEAGLGNRSPLKERKSSRPTDLKSTS
jgi:hypothetical protein